MNASAWLSSRPGRESRDARNGRWENYVHITEAGETFGYEPPDFYRPVDAATQLSEVFADLPDLWGGTERRLSASREAVARLKREL